MTERGDYDAFLLSLPLSLVLVAIWGVLQLGGLGDIPFHTHGEPREAIAVQDIVNSDRLVLPLRNGYEVPRKPPLFYWLGGLVGSARGGVDEASVRMPSAIQSCIGALLLLWVGVSAGSPWLGFFSGLALLTTFEWLRSAVSARIDMTLALGTTAAFAGLYLARVRAGIRPLILLYGGMIWGTLAKGPIGIILPTLAAMVILLSESGARTALPLLGLAAVSALAIQLGAPELMVAAVAASAFAVFFVYVAWETARPLHPIAGYACVGLVTLSWYVLAARSGGDVFVRLVIAENFGRFFGNASINVGHEHGFGYLIGSFAAGFLPWIVFLPSIAGVIFGHVDRRRRILISHCLVWFAVVFGFFSLSDSKRSVYLLPLYPAAACITGMWLDSIWNQRTVSHLLRLLMQGFALLLALAGGLVATAFALELAGFDLWDAIVQPILLELAGPFTAEGIRAGFAEQSPRILAFAAALLVSSLALWQFATIGQARLAVAALFAAVLSLQLVAQRAVMPAVSAAHDRRAFADRILDVAADRGVVTDQSFDPALTFHLGGAVPVVDLRNPDQVGSSLAVIPPHQWRRLHPRHREQFEVLPGLTVPKQNRQIPLLVVQRVPVRSTAAAAPRIDPDPTQN